jgi:DNA-directed RNA polymerase specialized sigma24 family protein
VKLSSKPIPIRDDELEALVCDCLNMLLSTLPPGQANIVRAVDMEQATPKSVAEIHRLSLSDVITQLAHGRQGLKDRFGEMLMICPQHGLAGCACHLERDTET